MSVRKNRMATLSPNVRKKLRNAIAAETIRDMSLASAQRSTHSIPAAIAERESIPDATTMSVAIAGLSQAQIDAFQPSLLGGAVLLALATVLFLCGLIFMFPGLTEMVSAPDTPNGALNMGDYASS